MRRLRQFGSFPLLLLAWLSPQLFTAQSKSPDDVTEKLGVRVHEYRLSESSLVEALCRVSRDFAIPMGITWVDEPAARQKLSLSWNDATVQEIIESIADTQPGYQVEISNGVMHVFSNSIVPNQNFLLLEIPHFAVQQQAIEMASLRLRELIKLIVSPPKLGLCCGTGGSLFGNVDEPKLNLQFDHATVEEILDALATVSNSNVWIVTFSDSLVLTPTGFRRSESIWNDFQVPDDEQPIWDRVRWGDPAPHLVRKVE